MGIFDRSSSQTFVDERSQQNILDADLSDAGVGVVGFGGPQNVNVNIQTTDYDAISTAAELGRDAFQLGELTVEQTLDANAGVLSDALDFGVDSIGAVSDIADRSLLISSDIVAGSNRFAGDAIDTVANLASDASRSVAEFGADSFSTIANFANDAFSGLNDAIGQVSASQRSDTANVLNNIVKFGAVAVGLIAVALIWRR